MTDLLDFLRAALDEDERVAREMAARVAADPGSYIMLGLAHPELAAGDCPSYLGEYDPARVLAEVAAKRAIVNHAESVIDLSAEEPGNRVLRGAADAWRQTLRLLAQPYAGRSGFREEWLA